MLVFSRKIGERIMIGQNVELLVVKTRAGRVKLAITAPPNVTIRRAELLASIQRTSPAETRADDRSIPASSFGAQR